MASGKGSASKVFQMRKQGLRVPGNVLRSARLILEGRGSEADQRTVRDFARERTPSAGPAGLSSVSSALGKAGQYSTLASTASQGGVGGAFAGMDLTNRVAGDIQTFLQSPQGQNMLEGVVTRLGGRAGLGARAGLGLARGIGVARVAGLYAEAGWKATQGAIEGVQSMTGMKLSRAEKDAQLAAKLATTAAERAAAAVRVQESTGYLRTLQTKGFSGAFDKLIGSDRRTFDKTRLARMGREGVAARERIYEEMGYLGRFARGLDKLTGTTFFAGGAGGIADKVEEQQARVAGYKATASSLLAEANVRGAQVVMDAIAAESLGEVPQRWKNPEALWKAQEADRIAVRTWAIANSPRAKSRTGD